MAMSELLVHLREAPKRTSTEKYLRDTFGDDDFDEAYKMGHMVGTPDPTPSKRVMTISLKGKEVIEQEPRGKENLYAAGMRILSEGISITEPPSELPSPPEVAPPKPKAPSRAEILAREMDIAEEAEQEREGFKGEMPEWMKPKPIPMPEMADVITIGEEPEPLPEMPEPVIEEPPKLDIPTPQPLPDMPKMEMPTPPPLPMPPPPRRPSSMMLPQPAPRREERREEPRERPQERPPAKPSKPLGTPAGDKAIGEALLDNALMAIALKWSDGKIREEGAVSPKTVDHIKELLDKGGYNEAALVREAYSAETGIAPEMERKERPPREIPRQPATATLSESMEGARERRGAVGEDYHWVRSYERGTPTGGETVVRGYVRRNPVD